MITDSGGRPIVYDVFVRAGTLIVVSTYHHHRHGPHLRIFANKRQMHELGFNEYEPVRVFILDLEGSPAPDVLVINDLEYQVSPETLADPGRAHGLAVATLFRDDARFIPNMIDWYRSQGCAKFYLYYNGSKLPDGLPRGSDVVYGLWDFPYWSRFGDWDNHELGWAHGAQPAFLTMARFRHLPDHEWMGFVDVDEHVVSRFGGRLFDVLMRTPSRFDVVRAGCHWARRETDCLVYTRRPLPRGERAKCFYRGTYAGFVGIHSPKKGARVKDHAGLRMLHVVNYGRSDRDHLVVPPNGRIEIQHGAPVEPRGFAWMRELGREALWVTLARWIWR